jgi:iron complex transport system ATP-binding protein
MSLGSRLGSPKAPSGADAEREPEALEARDLAIGFARAGRRSGGARAAERDDAHVLAAHLSFRVERGEALVLLGPNGAGKTTLLETLLGLRPALEGHVLLGGRDVRAYASRERACAIGYVPQASTFDFAFRVRDLVAMGRAPRLPLFALPAREDLRIVDEALEHLGIGHLADAREPELSGGERRLVLVARALAQKTRFLLLDEPTANLDYGSQRRVLMELDGLVRSGIGLIMTSHSPGHAFVCGTHAAFLDRRGGFTVGSVSEVITEERLARVYGVPFRIVSCPSDHGAVRACIPALGAPVD